MALFMNNRGLSSLIVYQPCIHLKIYLKNHYNFLFETSLKHLYIQAQQLGLLCDFYFQDFQLAVLNLSHSGGLTTQDGLVLIKRSISKHTTFLSQMFEPFLLGYWVRAKLR